MTIGRSRLQTNLELRVYTAQAPDSGTLAEMVKLQTSGKDANSIFYSGLSYLPLGIGQKFTIENKTVEHNLLVIEVTHNSEVHGNYSCTFKAIPADVGAPHYTDVHAYAKAESQPAKVTDNNDPDGLGRVKVEFYWAGGNKKSDWMRLIQPHAGAGKGFYFIPEVGEEVLVGFEGGNAERPFVMGTNYNGNEKSDYANAGNDFKVIKTRSGHYLEFEELKNIKLADKKGNIFHIDSEGSNINITALETVTIKCKNFIVDATENIDKKAGKDITIHANNDIIQSAGHDITQIAKGEFTEQSNSKTEIIDNDYNREAGETAD